MRPNAIGLEAVTLAMSSQATYREIMSIMFPHFSLSYATKNIRVEQQASADYEEGLDRLISTILPRNTGVNNFGGIQESSLRVPPAAPC